MSSVQTSSDSFDRHIRLLGAEELDEVNIQRHLWPLFSRSMQSSRGLIYLANHSLGRALDKTKEDVMEALGFWYMERENAWTPWLEEMDAFRSRIAALINAPRADCIVPKTSAGQGLRAILNCYDRSISVVASADEFNSIDHILKIYAERRRITLTRIAPKSGRFYRLEDFLGELPGDTELVVLSMVMFTTGQLLCFLPALIDAAHAQGAKVLLDLYHAAGTVPVDIDKLDADFAIGGSYKYLRGGPGASWLYMHPRHLDGTWETLDTGWFAEPDPFTFARPEVPEMAEGGNRFLESTPAVLPFYQARSGLKLSLMIGIERLRRYSLRQQKLLETSLQNANIPFLGQAEERGAFIAIPHPNAESLAERLAAAGVVCDAREGLLRLCPDILNTREELAVAAEKLVELWQEL